jgi:hypothetical protein
MSFDDTTQHPVAFPQQPARVHRIGTRDVQQCTVILDLDALVVNGRINVVVEEQDK